MYIGFAILSLLSVCYQAKALSVSEVVEIQIKDSLQSVADIVTASVAESSSRERDSVALLAESRKYIREGVFQQKFDKNRTRRSYKIFQLSEENRYLEILYATRNADMMLNLWNGDMGIALNKAQQRYLVACDLQKQTKDSIPQISAFCVAQTLYDVGYVSLVVNKQARAVYTLDKAISALESINKDGAFYLALKTKIYSAQIQALIKTRKFDSAMVLAERFQSGLPTSRAEYQPQLQTEIYRGADLYDIIMAYHSNALNFARGYVSLKDNKSASRYLDTAARTENYIQSSYLKSNLASERLRIEYLIAKEREKPDRLLPKIEEIISIEQFLNRRGLLMEAMQIKAQLLYEQGNRRESAAIFKETSQFFYSKAVNNIASLQNVIDLGLEKREMELKAQIATIKAENARRNTVLISYVSILLCVICGLIVYLLFKTNSKNKELSKRIQELAKAEGEIIIPVEQLSDNEKMVFRLKKELAANRDALIDNNLNRKMLADMVATNEVYLSNAIKEVTGMNVNDFVNRQKLNYALEIIAHRKDIKIDSLAAESGFGSRISLFRVFKKELGISPTTYIKSL